MSSISAHQCSITYQTMSDPVIDDDGNTYERTAIEQWLRVHGTSPMTRRPMSVGNLRPNRAVMNAILELKSEQSSERCSEQSSVRLSETKFQDATVEIRSGECVSQCTVNVEDGPTNPKKIVFVLDISGSMASQADPPGETTGLTRLDVAKHAILTCVQGLRPCDGVSIVTFSNSAKVVFPMCVMTDGAKGLLRIELIKIVEEGSTNIWDGIKTGFDQLSDTGSVFLLTDGCPNISPPKGHLRMLREYIDKRPNLDVVLHTFGFGYQLDSELLYTLANETQGSFAFIPDIGMVGTVFVHRMANELVTYVDKAWLLVETTGSVSGVPDATKTSWGYSIPMGPICHGQPRDIFFEHSENVQVSVKTSYWTKEAVPNCGRVTPNDRQCVSAGILECWTSSDRDNCLLRILEQISDTNLKKDIQGQITEAVEESAFKKWGRHFLPSIAMAHWRQNCNNFLDPGVQQYGGEMFQQTRDHLDELFNKLKPPTPTRSVNGCPTNISMASYNCRSGPCFTGDTLVTMADGTTKPCSKIRKGDMVDTTRGPAVMRCVIKTPCTKVNIVEYQGLRVTQWHPVINGKWPVIDGVWSFPIYLGETKEILDVDIFSFLLEPGFQDMLMGNNVPCITLAHGIKQDPVASHPFYGTEEVINSMKKLGGFEDGYVTLTGGVLIDAETNLVCGFHQ